MIKKIMMIAIFSAGVFLVGCGTANDADVTSNGNEYISVTGNDQTTMNTDNYSELSNANQEPGSIESSLESPQSKSSLQELQELSLAGIKFSIPESWKYEDVSDFVYLGYDLYPDSDNETNARLLQICFVSMDDIKEYPDPASVAKAVALAAWKREDCSDYSTRNTMVNDADVIAYDCVLPKQGIKETAYLFPVSKTGLLSIFYYNPISSDKYTDDVAAIVESVVIPEDSVIEDSISVAKAAYLIKEGSVSEVINLNRDDIDADYQENVPSEASSFDNSGHNYYKGISDDKAAQADQIAKQIADSIMNNPDYSTDLQKVQAAAEIVAEYCSKCAYGTDPTRYYRSPYGVFVAGIYTCAGSTRALGRVLDYMGYSWSHVNENQNRHQWAIISIDGQTGFGDGMAGIAGYGEMKNGMVLPDGSVLNFSE